MRVMAPSALIPERENAPHPENGGRTPSRLLKEIATYLWREFARAKWGAYELAAGAPPRFTDATTRQVCKRTSWADGVVGNPDLLPDSYCAAATTSRIAAPREPRSERLNVHVGATFCLAAYRPHARIVVVYVSDAGKEGESRRSAAAGPGGRRCI